MELTLPNIIVADRLRHRHFAIFKRPASVLLFLLIAAAVYWLWFGLTQRSFDGPETISLTAVRGILDYGIQRLPSGYLYHRGYIPNYLVAAFAGVFGFNQFAIIFPSLLMGLGTLFLTYLFGRDVLKMPWVGVVAAAILITLQVQTFYATSPRMYIALEFFTLLSLYSAWRGFVQGDKAFRFLTFLAFGAAILSNRQAILLIVAIPLSLLVVYWTVRGSIPRNLNPLDLLGILFVGLVVYFMFGYDVPGQLPAIAYDGGQDGGRTGIRLDPIQWIKHLYNAERSFPYASPLILASGLSFLALFRHKRLREASGVVYAIILTLVAGALSVLALGEITGTRFWLFLLPIVALLFTVGGGTLLELFGLSTHSGLIERRRLGIATALALVITGLFVSMSMGFIARGTQLTEIIGEGYGVPCNGADCDQRIRNSYAYLRDTIAPDDIVVSSSLTVTNHYLGKVDYLARTKTEKVKLLLKEEFFGVPVVDNAQELEALLNGTERVWIITHSNWEEKSNYDTRAFIETSFEIFDTSELMTIYVSCLDINAC